MIIDGCQLEWDRNRGVLYVHSAATGGTVLRICGLPPLDEKETLAYGEMLDITRPKIVGLPAADVALALGER